MTPAMRWPRDLEAAGVHLAAIVDAGLQRTSSYARKRTRIIRGAYVTRCGAAASRCRAITIKFRRSLRDDQG